MSKRDFFRILVKVFGLYTIVVAVYSTVPSVLSYVFNAQVFDNFGWIWGISTLVIIWGLVLYLIIKPDKVIDLLKLDSGFDNEEFNLGSFDSFKIIKLACLIVGGVIFIQGIPEFLSNLWFAFKSTFQSDIDSYSLDYGTTEDYIYWATSFLSILLGYLLIRNSEWVARKLSKGD